MLNRQFIPWLTLDMAVFAGINIFLLYRFGDQIAPLASIGFLHFLVLGLAAYRASNIVSNEVVTKPLRAPFVDETDQAGKIVEQPKQTGFLGAMGLLIYCPSCTGVWLSAALVYCYAFWPTPTFAIALLLALSGVERIMAVTLGWFKRGS